MAKSCIFDGIEAQIAENTRRAEISNHFVSDYLLRPDQFGMAMKEGHPVRFNTLSLPCWLDVALRAGVAHIGSRFLGSIALDEFADFVDGKETTLSVKVPEILSHLQPGEMLRYEHVAPASVKSARSYGAEMPTGLEPGGWLDLDDIRLVDTVFTLHEKELRIYARPIVEVSEVPGEWNGISGSWPTEYRAMIQGGRLIGISNYYPQVQLDPAVHREEVRQVFDLSKRMLQEMQASNISPTNPSFPEHPSGPSFTLDFLVKKDAEIVFLEGGPAALQAAHPCCFLDDENINLRGAPGQPQLHGVALATSAPVQSFAEFGLDPADIPSLEGMWQPVPDFDMPTQADDLEISP